MMCRLSPTGDDGDVHMRGLISPPMRCEEKRENIQREKKNSSTVSVSRNRFTHPKVRPREIFCVFFTRFFFSVWQEDKFRVSCQSPAQSSRLKSIACCSKDRTPEQKNKIGSERAKRNLIDRESLPPVIFLLSNISREWKIIKIQAPIKIEKYLIFLSQKRTDQHVVVDSAFFVSLVLLFQLIGIESLRVLDSPQRCVASS